MEEKRKHKVMIGIEVILLGMILAIVGTNAASSNPPSNGVSYSKNNQTTVEGALNDLYNKANYGNASAGQILSGKTALVGGKQVTGTIPNRMFTGNVTGGLNTSYPNIALNVGGNTQLTTGTNGVEYIATSPPQGWYEGGGSSYTVIPKSTVISLYGITANKILKGQSIAGVVGTGETSCPTCESQGYYKFWKFDKDATYTRTSTGTDTALSLGSYKRLCADNKTCTYWFTIPLDSGITVKKIHSCTANLSTKNDGPTGGTSFIESTKGDARTTHNGFRMNRGYSAASSSGTQQYWYMDSLQASQVWGDIESYGVTATGSGWHSAWGTWSDSGMNMETTQAGGQGFSTSCSVNGSNFVMSVYISDSALATYDSSFMLSGSMTYQ